MRDTNVNMVSQNAIKEQIEGLRRELNYHNHKYYVENAPEISDFDFDAKMRLLQDLEAAHPEYADPNSPSVRVGSDRCSEFQSVEHRYPMLSLSNTYSIEELGEFIERIEREADDVEFVCELKFDGTAISLTYENGRLLRAVTRGDGVQGKSNGFYKNMHKDMASVRCHAPWPVQSSK